MKENDKKVKQLAKDEKKKKDEEEKRLKREKEKKEKEEKKKVKKEFNSGSPLEPAPEASGPVEAKRNSLTNHSTLPSTPTLAPASTSTPTSSRLSTPGASATPPTDPPPNKSPSPPPTLTPPPTKSQDKSPTMVKHSTDSQSRSTTPPHKRDNAFDFWLQQDKLQQDKKGGSPVNTRRVEEDTGTHTSLSNNTASQTFISSTFTSPSISPAFTPPSTSSLVKPDPSKVKPSPKSSVRHDLPRADSATPTPSVKHDPAPLKVNSSPIKRTTPPPLKQDVSTTPPQPHEGANRKELVSSLASHMAKCVACMHKTIQVFLHPIYDAVRREPAMLEPCTKQGFSLYESMYGLNNVLREDLDKSISSWSEATSLGPLFLKIVGYFKMYGQYAGQYNLMIAMINFLAFDNPRFEALVKSGEQKMTAEFGNKTPPIVELASNTRIVKPFQLRTVLSLGASSAPLLVDNYDFYSFPTLLLAPICFIQSQATLLRALTLATPRTHTDFAQLNTALSRFEETISSILVEADVIYKTLFIQHTIRSSTIGLFGEPLPTRKLLKEGTIIEGCDIGVTKLDMVFLFSDIVAFTDPPSLEGVHVLKRYEIVSDCKVSDPDLGFDNKKGFQLKTKEKTLMLYAQSEREKMEWINAFTKAQKTAVLTIKTSLEPEAERALLSDFEAAIRELKFGEGEKLELHALKAEEGKELLVVLAGRTGMTHLSISSSPALGERFVRSLSSWLALSPSLTHLTLSQVSLTSATAVVLADAMNTNVHISHLDLRGNSIADVGVVALSEAMIVAPRLTSFHLENNSFGEVGVRAIASNLKHSHALSVLGLEGNSIPSDVMVSHFADCVLSTIVTPLTVVTFDNPEFQKKIEVVLTNNKHRKERQEAGTNPISGAEIRTIDMGYLGSGELNIQMLNKVSTIRLDHNSFTRVNESVIGQLTGLHTLLAYYNDIREISLPTTLTNLSYLDLAHNRLNSIPQSVYALHGLTLLDVSSNNISAVSAEIKSLSSLSTLMLQTNSLARLPKELLSVTTLTRLSVGGNSAIPITSQKIFAAWAAQLTKLDISRSCINALPTDISVLTRLTDLDLSHNELKTVPPQIADLTNLKVLDLSHNPQMGSLPVQLWKLTNLQKLNIEGNHPHMYSDGVIKSNMETGAILAALKQQDNARSMQPCNRLKLMLVGQENVGKTTLAKALKKGPKNKRAAAITTRLKEGALAIGMLAPVPHSSTPTTPTGSSTGGSLASTALAPNVSTDGIDMEEWDPEDDGSQHISFTIWDFAGQEVYYATHAFFLSARSIFIVCFNMATGDDAAKVPYHASLLSYSPRFDYQYILVRMHRSMGSRIPCHYSRHSPG